MVAAQIIAKVDVLIPPPVELDAPPTIMRNIKITTVGRDNADMSTVFSPPDLVVTD